MLDAIEPVKVFSLKAFKILTLLTQTALLCLGTA